MRLSLIVRTYKGSPAPSGGRKELPPSGGTIGRSPDNDVVLQDPERFVSGCHARVRVQDGVIYLDDLSRNGVFLNGATEPLGQTRSARLRDGDVLAIGEYELLVEIEATPSRPADDPFGSSLAPQPPARASERAHPGSVIEDKHIDPLELLGGVGRAAPSARRPGSQPDHVPPEARHFEPPRVAVDPRTPLPPTPPPRTAASRTPAARAAPTAASTGVGIPDDWDLTGIADAPEPPPRSVEALRSPVPVNSVDEDHAGPASDGLALPEDWDLTGAAQPSPVRQAESGFAPAQPSDSPALPATTVAPDPSSSNEDAFAARLAAAAGVAVPDGSIRADLPEIVGALAAELALGFVELLAGRSTFKSELRMDATGIQPRENNPLKFASDGAEALGHLLFSSGTGFRGPVESVQEAVQDLKAHQVAMIAAMRAALDALMKRFDPDALEARFDEQGKASLLSLSGKGRYWEAYRELMAGLQKDPDAFFKEMFADEFVQAYERQIDLLSRRPR